MGLQPNIKQKGKTLFRTCTKCGQTGGEELFPPTKSPFYPDGFLPICSDCLDDYLEKSGYEWDAADKLCQLADIPFIPTEWEKLRDMSEQNLFYRYANVFQSSEYAGLGWKEYFDAFSELKAQGAIEGDLPLIGEDKRRKLVEKWGANYDDEALNYLEHLFSGLLATQNINGALQMDQAIKICKMSYEIDQRIAEGADFDKLLSSYDKLVKSAEFTPKNVKNINDFDTAGEIVKWMEKKGWRNKFYDNVSRDVVDESIKNIQAFNQRLYTNESNIGEEINRRIEALNSVVKMENYYDVEQDNDLETYDQDGYDDLFANEDEEEFDASLED